MKDLDNGSAWWSFLALCVQLKTSEELNELFDLFFTIQERKDIADRYLIIKELLRGNKTQREMAEELKVSIAKITRGSNTLKTMSKSCRDMLIKKIR